MTTVRIKIPSAKVHAIMLVGDNEGFSDSDIERARGAIARQFRQSRDQVLDWECCAYLREEQKTTRRKP